VFIVRLSDKSVVGYGLSVYSAAERQECSVVQTESLECG
jgi:hypothetical protein